jgi:oligoribonuclease (3'-5' exoribonuclease)
MAHPLPKDPLVWIDCEMTGLDLAKDRLLEIAVRSCCSAVGKNPH